MCIALQALDEFDRVFYERAIEKNTGKVLGIFDIKFTEEGVIVEFPSNQVREYRHIDDLSWNKSPTNQETVTVHLNDDVCKPLLFHLSKKRVQDENQKIDSDVDFISLFRLLPGEEKFILRRVNPKSIFEEE